MSTKRLTSPEYSEYFYNNCAAIIEVASADLSAKVPACPGWTMRDLVEHIRHVAWIPSVVLPTMSTEAPDWSRLPAPIDDSAALISAAKDQVAVATVELSRVDQSAQCWTMRKQEPTAGFWPRRAALETAVHRFDAESAVGAPTACEAPLAADGIDELLDGILFGQLHRHPEMAPGGVLEVEAVDQNTHWRVAAENDSIVLDPGQNPAVTIRGNSAELFLVLWGRLERTRITTKGDLAVLGEWLALVP